MKRFKNILTFKMSQEFRKKDLSFCDLSNLDLSKIPSHTWDNFKFFHTDLSNTNIVFDPEKLAKDANGNSILEYTSFRGCDLSYIKSFYHTSINGSDFYGTNLDLKLDVHNTTYSINMEETIFSKEMEKEVLKKSASGIITIKTVKNNPHIKFSSIDIFNILKNELNSIGNVINDHTVSKFMPLIMASLECDRKNEGYLDKLFNIVNSSFKPFDVFQFFRGVILNKKYDYLDLSDIPYQIINKFKFFDCKINTLKLPDIDETKNFHEHINFSSLNSGGYTKIPHLIINNITPESYNLLKERRLGETCFTFLTNLYLELGRSCNAKCDFCRNNALPPCKFDFEAITSNFFEICSYLDYVVVGGGEPLLYFEQLMSLLEYYGRTKDFFVSTNGTSSLDALDEILKYSHINLSRHAVEDDENNSIFHAKTLSTSDINHLTFYSGIKKVNLVATCKKNGLDTPEKLFNYIDFSDDVRSDGVIFQNLHEDLSVDGSKQIDGCVFDEVIKKLKEKGYIIGKLPIYSTGDYKLIIVKNPNTNKTIAFKKYITEEELKREWQKASKRTFDLSMAPNGDVYQNWHQKSELILSRRK